MPWSTADSGEVPELALSMAYVNLQSSHAHPVLLSPHLCWLPSSHVPVDTL